MTIAIPDAALPYLLLQRTDVLVLPKHRLLYRVACKLSRKPPLMVAVLWESRLRKGAARRAYDLEMQGEYAGLRDWLPEHPATILDIGCGVGGFDVLLFEHYRRDPALRFFLLDKTGMSDAIEHGFKDRHEFYNSLDLTRDVLTTNGMPSESLTTIEVRDDTQVEIPEPMDLIVSLRSWGFHYPVSTYLDRAYEWLRPGGRLILDVRTGTDGREQVEAKFGNVKVISETSKQYRIMATRPLGE